MATDLSIGAGNGLITFDTAMFATNIEGFSAGPEDRLW